VTSGAAPFEPPRLARADRREDLLDAALVLVASGDVDGVSMDSVADRAGVSRSLVYKHFANRTEILTALYEREGTRLHNELSAAVLAARSLEEKYRALCHGSLVAAKARGQIFDGLRSAAGRNKALRKLQRDRDRVTAATYVHQTVQELGVAEHTAEPVTQLLLGAITPMLTLWHSKPGNDYAEELEEAYMCLVRGALAQLRDGAPMGNAPRTTKPSATADADLSAWLSDRIEQASPEQLRQIVRGFVDTVADVSADTSRR
jgi:AcrR family transcriptional regulator